MTGSDPSLESSLFLLRSVMDASVDLIFVKDTELRTILCNRAFATALKKSPEEIYGKTDIENGWDPVLVKGDPAKGINGYEHDDRRALMGEIVHNPADPANVNGAIRIFDTYKTPLRNAAGTIVGLLAVSRDITDRVELEHSAKGSRAELAALVEAVPDYIVKVDSDLRFTFANRIYPSATMDQVLGRSILEWIPASHVAAFESALRSVFSSGAPGEIETPAIGDDPSRPMWCVMRIRPLLEDGRVTQLLVLTQDITDRKLSETQRVESEARFRSIIENSPVPLALNDDDGKITYLNPAFTKAFGYDIHDIPTLQDWWPRAYPDEGYRAWVAETWAVRLEVARKNNEEFEPFEVRLQAKNGTERTVIGYAIRLASSFWGIHAVILYDITERKKAEDDLAREKERLAVTLHSIGDGVITTDITGKVIDLNRVAEDLTGWRQWEARGRALPDVFQLIRARTRKPVEDPLRRVLYSGVSLELDTTSALISRHGDEALISFTASAVRNAHGDVIGAVVVFRNITEENRLIEATQRADKLDSLGILAGGIAHDFNNLLAGMFGYMEMARSAGRTDAKVSSYLDKAMAAFARARDLTGQLLTFAKGGTPVRRTGDLGTLVRDTTTFMLSGSTVKANFVIPDDLWLCDFDANQIGQVIDNLVINAQQAMPLGGNITLSLRNRTVGENEVALIGPGRYVEIVVKDTGPGVQSDHLARVFDPFFTTKEKGHGLGLATCYSIIRRHEGAIEAASKIGDGMTFTILLPASDAAVEPLLPSRNPVHHSGSGSVLILDDEDFMRDIMAEMLSRMGYTPIAAHDGKEALAICETMDPDAPLVAAFLDLTVPGGTGGREVIGEIRRRFPNLAVFAASGYSDDPVIAHPADHGFTDSLRKPFKFNEMADLLAKHAPRK